MNFLDMIRSGLPFRRPGWVDDESELRWCVFATDYEFNECHILWEDGSTFGNITDEMLNATDFEIDEIEKNLNEDYLLKGWIDSLKFITFISDMESEFNIIF